ncbi:hypothetical protein AXG93_436s1390 [Marchantia polymorpha subsp. ruderalis]|uniref:Uncharacterized protein n=1 Tax=Marchantia polymorpha subsp. ruderalis TaxID=1480154 RepID=A0A176VBM7_MARPO|nr:hypothetical protein AXG93_436s1390 [Marchantia polymorpha subsp. ruderalis]
MMLEVWSTLQWCHAMGNISCVVTNLAFLMESEVGERGALKGLSLVEGGSKESYATNNSEMRKVVPLT